jgi:hypothetical protein
MIQPLMLPAAIFPALKIWPDLLLQTCMTAGFADDKRFEQRLCTKHKGCMCRCAILQGGINLLAMGLGGN